MTYPSLARFYCALREAGASPAHVGPSGLARRRGEKRAVWGAELPNRAAGAHIRGELPLAAHPASPPPHPAAVDVQTSSAN